MGEPGEGLAAWTPGAGDWPLATDLYEFTMLDAYLQEGMTERAVFSLFVRKLPPQRNFLVACGLEDALQLLESLRFGEDSLRSLASLGRLTPGLLRYLEGFRFSGEVDAVPEGTLLFPHEPLLEVVAPLPEAQLVETLLMNQVHLQTVAASKAVRVVEAAAGRPVVEFGLRRIHGVEAGLKVARAAWVAGCSATSNVQAGRVYGMPVLGTMAHSYVQAHASEKEALRAFLQRFPRATLLVDTYDTVSGVRHAIEVARELGPSFVPTSLRLDSGDLLSLSRAARALLDEAGLGQVKLFASGGLDETRIQTLVRAGAPIDGFGVGTRMGVSADAPSLDMAYKLVAYASQGRMKLSTGKVLHPGRKQVFRQLEAGLLREDVLGLARERHEGQPLLVPVMREGRRLPEGMQGLEAARARVRAGLASLPPALRALEPAERPYPVRVSPALQAEEERLVRELTARNVD
jgi:nicotinate phosphoribosyltransferase